MKFLLLALSGGNRGVLRLGRAGAKLREELFSAVILGPAVFGKVWLNSNPGVRF